VPRLCAAFSRVFDTLSKDGIKGPRMRNYIELWFAKETWTFQTPPNNVLTFYDVARTADELELQISADSQNAQSAGYDFSADRFGKRYLLLDKDNIFQVFSSMGSFTIGTYVNNGIFLVESSPRKSWSHGN